MVSVYPLNLPGSSRSEPQRLRCRVSTIWILFLCATNSIKAPKGSAILLLYVTYRNDTVLERCDAVDWVRGRASGL